MGLSCHGRKGGPHGQRSTEGGRATGLHGGVQAGRGPATREGREDPGGGGARTRYPAQGHSAVDAAGRGRGEDGGGGERGRRACERLAGGSPAYSGTRASLGQEADGDRDSAGGPGGRKK